MTKEKEIALNGSSAVCYECGTKHTSKAVGIRTAYQEECAICGQEKMRRLCLVFW